MSEVPVLKIDSLSKRFPGVQALDSVCLQIRQGEVHAIIGENGAGKSTLMKILAGAEKPDQGSIQVRGRRVATFDPQTARRMGVGIIFQEFNLIPHFSAAKNIALGCESHRLGWISNQNEIKAAERWLNEIEAAVPALAPVQRLSVGQQQQVEIAKAISQNAAILIMDEPTSALSAAERRHLFTLIDKLRQRAITVLYVSHSLEEIFRVSDRVTVLKDGRLVFTKPTEETNTDELITAMVGRQLDRVFPPKSGHSGDTLLAVKNLGSGQALRDVSFELKKGEILGVYGLVGAGRTEMCKALFGALSASGEMSLNGNVLHNRDPGRAIKNKMAFMTEDRKTEGLIMGLSLRENMALPSLTKRATLGIINHREERREIEASCQNLKIKTASIENDVYYLSGGNQQKAVIGKWLLSAPLILICDEPTRGVDVGAKMEIYTHLRRLAGKGLSIILVSSELPEIIGLSDRILVMRAGTIACELEADGVTEEKILAAGLGKPVAEEAASRAQPPHPGLPASRGSKLNVLRHHILQTDLVVFATLLCLLGVGIFTSDSFLNKYNLTSIIRHAAALGIVSMGQAVVMISGGLDISVGSLVSLTTIVAALQMNGSDAMIPAAVMVCLGAGLIVGCLNGFAVVKLKIVPFIATLGMMSVVHGVVLLIAKGPVGSVGKAFRLISRGSVGPFPAALLIIAVVFVVALLVMNKSIYGRHLSATGASPEVSRLGGIRVSWVTFSSYVVSALCAVLAGLYLTSRMGMGDPLVGRGFEVDSIIAVLIGGIPFGGGRGNILGVIAGVLLLAVLGNLLTMWNLHSWYHQIVKAGILLVAISIYKRE